MLFKGLVINGSHTGEYVEAEYPDIILITPTNVLIDIKDYKLERTEELYVYRELKIRNCIKGLWVSHSLEQSVKGDRSEYYFDCIIELAKKNKTEVRRI